MKTIKLWNIKWDPTGKGYDMVSEFSTASFYSENDNITAAEALANVEKQAGTRVLSCSMEILDGKVD
jgi:hypothetical protein